VIGDISLQAQEPVHIADVKVYPRINTSEVEVKVLVENKSKEDFSGKLAFNISLKMLIINRFQKTLQSLLMLNGLRKPSKLQS
jgi:hypothetical protein